MRHLKLMIIVLLICLMALPAVAGRRKEVKKSASALLSSGRIALADNPPRFEEA